MDTIEELQKRLGYKFKDKELLIKALTHKSVKKRENNERLEFLGDAVLDLIIGEFLFESFPNANEGELSKMRASLVNEKSFAKMANYIRLGDAIFISQAEEVNKGRNKPSLLSNAFEAIIGAIYLEKGIEVAREVATKIVKEVYPKIDLGSLFRDYKTALQELTQARFGVIPEYVLVRSSGLDHEKEFEVLVYIAGKEYSKGIGKSKKEAQQEAAKLTLEMLQGQNFN